MTSVPSKDAPRGRQLMAARAALRALIVIGLAVILIGIVIMTQNDATVLRITGFVAAMAGFVMFLVGVRTWAKTRGD